MNLVKTVKEMHYVPNFAVNNLSTSNSETIGRIVSDIENLFFSEMTRAIEGEEVILESYLVVRGSA